MKRKAIVGALMVIGGFTMLYFGVHAKHSYADQQNWAATGLYTGATLGHLIGGGLIALLGMVAIIASFRGEDI